jgi:hypothetical protein
MYLIKLRDASSSNVTVLKSHKKYFKALEVWTIISDVEELCKIPISSILIFTTKPDPRPAFEFIAAR